MSNYNVKISELKGSGILLVVIGHAAISTVHGYSLRNFIYLFQRGWKCLWSLFIRVSL